MFLEEKGQKVVATLFFPDEETVQRCTIFTIFYSDIFAALSEIISVDKQGISKGTFNVVLLNDPGFAATKH